MISEKDENLTKLHLVCCLFHPKKGGNPVFAKLKKCPYVRILRCKIGWLLEFFENQLRQLTQDELKWTIIELLAACWQSLPLGRPN